jgi:protein SCO1/2
MRHPANISITLVTLSLFALSLAGCQAKPKRYDLRGKVLLKNHDANEITVDHQDIPGFMSAMAMPYKVKGAGSLDVQPGDKITATVVVSGNGTEYWLEQVRVIDSSGRKAAQALARPNALPPGSPVPDLALTNQDGRNIRLKDFTGKALLINFIYTRCPLPEFCPRLSNQFSTIRENLAKTPAVRDKTHLLSISIDPKNDTAAVLRKYGLSYMDNDPTHFSQWEFAFTSPANLRKFADLFGLEYLDDNGQIIHSVSVILVGPDGTISQYWGQNATTAQLEAALRESVR